MNGYFPTIASVVDTGARIDVNLGFNNRKLTIVYRGEGFEPYIEAYRDYPSIQWVKG